MSYIHIENLYRPEAQVILMFKEVYALEKLHGSLALINWTAPSVRLFSNGDGVDGLDQLFDLERLKVAFECLGYPKVMVYGEAYGGKQQGMSRLYGKDLRFAAFDVRVGNTWLNVPNAEDVAHKLGLIFVPYNRTSTDLAALDALRDADSIQSVLNGNTKSGPREGIVIRPLQEFFTSNGNRVIAKHKSSIFAERLHPPKVVDVAKQELLRNAEAVATEFVTPMRLTHVLDHLGNPTDLAAIGKVAAAMVEDVCREGAGEFEETKAVRVAIGKLAARLYKQRISEQDLSQLQTDL